jgi:Zn-finger nucleic acid-binding protein
MNCTNCGAPMILVLDQRQFVCEHCSSIYFPLENTDGVRILDEASQTDCPVCKSPLIYGFADWTKILYCQNCRGMLFNQGAFSKVIKYLRAIPSGPPVEIPPMNPEELERRISCPECGRMMSTHPYGGPGNIVVDNCIHCELIWLDHTEFQRVIRAPGRDRGHWR